MSNNPWQGCWEDLRCIIAETFLSWALSVYPDSSPLKLRLAAFIKDEFTQEIERRQKC